MSVVDDAIKTIESDVREMEKKVAGHYSDERERKIDNERLTAWRVALAALKR